MTDLIIAVVRVILNGFFIAAEFAPVKVRRNQFVNRGKLFSNTARWPRRLDRRDVSRLVSN